MGWRSSSHALGVGLIELVWSSPNLDRMFVDQDPESESPADCNGHVRKTDTGMEMEPNRGTMAKGRASRNSNV